MGKHRRIVALGRLVSYTGATAVMLATFGCGRREAPPPPAAVAQAAASIRIAPADHALPGEIAEGSEKAFGFPIPRRMSVTARFPDAVFAAGEFKHENVANYVRQRVLAGHVETGPARTVFTRATLKSDPNRLLRIDVLARGAGTELFVRDETQPPPKQSLTPEERWKELGLSPNGTPLDPTRLE